MRAHRQLLLDPGFELTLRPMRYPQFYEMYRNAIRNTWTVEEVDFSLDVNDLKHKFGPAERHLIEKQVKALEGHPIVINKWASWCRPCRAEFPIFQQVAAERGKEVAFLGVNAADKRPAAEKFLNERPLPYPSFEDPDEDIARELDAAKFFPMTIFVDAKGDTAFVKAGEYTSRAELEADIDKYLGDA